MRKGDGLMRTKKAPGERGGGKFHPYVYIKIRVESTERIYQMVTTFVSFDHETHLVSFRL